MRTFQLSPKSAADTTKTGAIPLTVGSGTHVALVRGAIQRPGVLGGQQINESTHMPAAAAVNKWMVPRGRFMLSAHTTCSSTPSSGLYCLYENVAHARVHVALIAPLPGRDLNDWPAHAR